MKVTQYILIAFISVFVLTACDSAGEDIENPDKENETNNTTADLHEDAENYIVEIDEADLSTGNSLYYSRNDGASIEVDVFVDSAGYIVKLVEQYTRSAQGSIESNVFYYKNDKKYASKEYFEEGVGEGSLFVERVTYYDEKGSPKITKQRKAKYEDALVEELFTIARNHNCSDENAYKVVNQQGEFETTFQGFVKDEHLVYLIVGENKKEGYASTLVVQQMGPTIKKLMANESAMIGTPLTVDFQTSMGDLGFEFQALLNISIK